MNISLPRACEQGCKRDAVSEAGEPSEEEAWEVVGGEGSLMTAHLSQKGLSWPSWQSQAS